MAMDIGDSGYVDRWAESRGGRGRARMFSVSRELEREREALSTGGVPCLLLRSTFCLGKAPISKILCAMATHVWLGVYFPSCFLCTCEEP